MAVFQEKNSTTPSDWRPNWKNPSEYPASRFPRHWAWEFLRRNPEYQSDYEYAQQFCLSGGGYAGNSPYSGILKKYGISTMLPDPSNSQAAKPTGGLLFSGEGIRIHQYSEREKVQRVDGDFEWPYRTNFHPPLPAHEAEIYLQFDLSKPLGPQLNHAKAVLHAHQQHGVSKGRFEVKNNRFRPRDYPDYLRLLDSRDAGASLKESGMIIYSIGAGDWLCRKTTVEAALAAALRLRDNDYQLLPLVAPYGGGKKQSKAQSPCPK